MYLGDKMIDDTLTFTANTHDPSDGSASDVDGAYNSGVPKYRIYEDETTTPIATGSMAKLDDVNTTGFYSEKITLAAATGYEIGKTYTIYIEAQVNSIVATMSHTFTFCEAIHRILGAVGGKVIVNAAGTEVQKYDYEGNLMVTLARTGTGPYTWTPTWA